MAFFCCWCQTPGKKQLRQEKVDLDLQSVYCLPIVVGKSEAGLCRAAGRPHCSEVERRDRVLELNSLALYPVQGSAVGWWHPYLGRASFHFSQSNLETSLQPCSEVGFLGDFRFCQADNQCSSVMVLEDECEPGCALRLWACVDSAPCNLVSQQTVPARNCLFEVHLLLLKEEPGT